MKYIILLSISSDIGGAQKRYISLFNEISKRNSDYTLVINKSLFDLAQKSSLIIKSDKIKILEIDKITEESNRKNNFNEVKKIRKKILPIFIRNIINWVIDFYKLCSFIFALNKIFKNNKPTYVYAIWLGGMISWPLKYIYKFKMSYAYMDSGFSSIYPFYKHLLKNETNPLQHCDQIDFLSLELKTTVNKKIKIPQQIIQKVSICSFKNYDILLPQYPKKNWMVFASRLTPIKNPIFLMESIKIASYKCEDVANYKFWILGDGELLEEALNYKSKINLENIEITGYIKDPENYLSFSKVFFSLQKNNNYPSQSLLEAMACENFIVATNVGETKLLIDENNGILIKENTEELANAICYCIKNDSVILASAKKNRAKILSEHSIENYLKYFYSLENFKH
jgi:glycosyltransferase involved in cell wall biosynthesis